MKKTGFLALALLSCNSFAGEVAVTLQASQISLVQVHTTKNVASGAANTAILATSSLSAPCSKGVFIDVLADEVTYSTALAAISAGKSIRLLYNTSIPSPWGDSAWCAVSALGITN